MGMAGTSWKYQKYTYSITAFESYDKYTDFADKYVNPYVSDAQNLFVIVNTYNNTSNTRAVLYHVEYISASTRLINIGKRVGANFLGDYGGDLYPGATLEVYISYDMPNITIS